jgi:hypothetical protein
MSEEIRQDKAPRNSLLLRNLHKKTNHSAALFRDKKNISMCKKDYEKPAITVVELQQQSQILAGSLATTRTDYGSANSDTGITQSEIIDGEWVWQ